MGFSGDLKAIGFGNVFQGIQTNQSSGTLRVFNERHSLYVHFLEGKVTMAAPLGLSAEHRGVRAREANLRRIDALLRSKSPEAEAYRAKLQAAVCERIYDAFTWSTAQFEFNEGKPPRNIFMEAPVDAGFHLGVEPILMEAARRDDEWTRIHRQIRSLDEIFVQIGVPGEGEAGPEGLDAEVMARMDAETSLRDVIAELPYGRFAVCKSASDLLRSGWIQPLSIEERVQVARRLESQGQIDSAIAVITAALEHERNDPALHELLGELQDQAGRPKRAAQSFSLAADAYIALNKDAFALKFFAKAVAKTPRDPVVRERQLSLLFKRGATREALQHGRTLAELYMKKGLVQKARDTYARLTKAAPADDDLKENLAQCEQDLGNASEAVKLYRPLVAKSLKSRRFANGVRLLREILKTSPGHGKAQRTLSRLESGRHAASQRRRKRVRRIASYGMVGALLLLASVYEITARSYYHETHRSNIALIADGHHFEAIAAYRNVVETYPWGIVQIEVDALVDGLAAQLVVEIERRSPSEGHDAAMKKLDAVLELSPSASIIDRARCEITRALVEKRVLGFAAALSDRKRRPEAKAALLGIADPTARRVLEELLASKNEEVRFLALAPLTTIKDFRSIPVLIDLLRDSSARVRERAHTALVVLTSRNTRDARYQPWIKWWRTIGQQEFQAR